jgi:hypothetical protein
MASEVNRAKFGRWVKGEEKACSNGMGLGSDLGNRSYGWISEIPTPKRIPQPNTVASPYPPLPGPLAEWNARPLKNDLLKNDLANCRELW